MAQLCSVNFLAGFLQVPTPAYLILGQDYWHIGGADPEAQEPTFQVAPA